MGDISLAVATVIAALISVRFTPQARFKNATTRLELLLGLRERAAASGVNLGDAIREEGLRVRRQSLIPALCRKLEVGGGITVAIGYMLLASGFVLNQYAANLAGQAGSLSATAQNVSRATGQATATPIFDHAKQLISNAQQITGDVITWGPRVALLVPVGGLALLGGMIGHYRSDRKLQSSTKAVRAPSKRR